MDNSKERVLQTQQKEHTCKLPETSSRHRACTGLSQMGSQHWERVGTWTPTPHQEATHNWHLLERERFVFSSEVSLGIWATAKGRPHAQWSIDSKHRAKPMVFELTFFLIFLCLGIFFIFVVFACLLKLLICWVYKFLFEGCVCVCVSYSGLFMFLDCLPVCFLKKGKEFCGWGGGENLVGVKKGKCDQNISYEKISIEKKRIWGWREGSAGKSTGCSSRRRPESIISTHMEAQNHCQAQEGVSCIRYA